jgi:hypothetical protein
MFQRLETLFLTDKMALIYDIRHNRGYQRSIVSKPQLEQRWHSYLRGESAVSVIEGRIVRLFDEPPYQGEPRFEIDGPGFPHTRSFFCQGDISHYVVGHYAKVEQTLIFYDDQSTVTRIWIYESTA